MIKDEISKPLLLSQTLKLHSYALTPLSDQQVPIYQNSQKPYDYYLGLTLELKEEAPNLQFYQSLAALSPAIIQIEQSQVIPVQCTFWGSLLGKTESSGAINLYMKYYNFRLKDLIQLKKKSQGEISQQELLYILQTLLQIAVGFKRNFKQFAQVFTSQKVFLTNLRKIVLYPTFFRAKKQPEKLQLQRSVNSYSQKYQTKVLTQQRLFSNSTESTLQSSRLHQTTKVCSFQDKDLMSIFFLLLELLTFKPRDFFFSEKHQMMKQDLVRQHIHSKEEVGQISEEFAAILEEILLRNIDSCQILLSEINKLSKMEEIALSCFGKSSEKGMKTKKQLSQEETLKERTKKLSKTCYLDQLTPIKKCNSLQ